MSIALAIALALASVESTAQAREAEEAAFAAVERKEWCTAMQLFLQAYDHAPSEDFLLNAAMAAEYATDRAAARALYVRVVEQLGPRLVEAKKRQAALEDAIARDGAGTACAPPPEPAPEVAPAPAPASAPSGPPLVPLSLVAAGALTTAGGAALLAAGALPWFQHASAAGALREAERSGEDDARALAALHGDQADARGRWESWGQALVVVGAVAAGVGAVCAATGAALWVMEGE